MLAGKKPSLKKTQLKKINPTATKKVSLIPGAASRTKKAPKPQKFIMDDVEVADDASSDESENMDDVGADGNIVGLLASDDSSMEESDSLEEDDDTDGIEIVAATQTPEEDEGDDDEEEESSEEESSEDDEEEQEAEELAALDVMIQEASPEEPVNNVPVKKRVVNQPKKRPQSGALKTPDEIAAKLTTEEERELHWKTWNFYSENPDQFCQSFLVRVKEAIDDPDGAWLPKSEGCKKHNWINGTAQKYLRECLQNDTDISGVKVPAGVYHAGNVHRLIKERNTDEWDEQWNRAFSTQTARGGFKKNKKSGKRKGKPAISEEDEDIQVFNPSSKKRRRKPSSSGVHSIGDTDSSEDAGGELNHTASVYDLSDNVVQYTPKKTEKWMRRMLANKDAPKNLEKISRRVHFSGLVPDDYVNGREHFKQKAQSAGLLQEGSFDVSVNMNGNAYGMICPLVDTGEPTTFETGSVFYATALARVSDSAGFVLEFPRLNLVGLINERSANLMTALGAWKYVCVGDVFSGWFCVCNDKLGGYIVYLGDH